MLSSLVWATSLPWYRAIRPSHKPWYARARARETPGVVEWKSGEPALFFVKGYFESVLIMGKISKSHYFIL